LLAKGSECGYDEASQWERKEQAMDDYMSLFNKVSRAAGLYGKARSAWQEQLAKEGKIDRESIMEPGVEPGVERNIYQFALSVLEPASQHEIASDTRELAQVYLEAFDQLSILLENLRQYLANISGEADSAEHH
jgi:hypothetical protein